LSRRKQKKIKKEKEVHRRSRAGTVFCPRIFAKFRKKGCKSFFFCKMPFRKWDDARSISLLTPKSSK